MRKILIVVVFFLIILLSSIYGGNNLDKQSITYDIDEVNKIVVNLDKADVNIITTDIDKIQVETSSNTLTRDAESYFSYVEEETLYIQNYVENENNFLNPHTKVNIYIPKEASINEILVNIKQGSISLTDVELKVANLQGEDVSINVENSIIDNLNIGTSFGKVNVKNTNAIDVNINCTKANITIDHLVSTNLSVNSDNKANIEFVNNVVETFNTTGENIQISMTLYNTYDYNINSNIPLNNKELVLDDNFYKYNVEAEEGINTFYFVNTKIEELNFSQK